MVYSQPASQLINHANVIARERHDPAVDLLHVLLAAVRDPMRAGHAGNILMQYLRNEHDRWSLLIEYELDIRPPQVASSGYKSARLDWFERNWDRWITARSGWVGITCSLMLATILAFEPTQEKMARRCGIDRDSLIRSLSNRAPYSEDGPGTYGSPGSYGVPGDYNRPGDFGSPGDFGPPGVWMVPDQMPSPFPPNFPPISGEVPAIAARPSALQRFGRPVAATPTRLYAHIHPPITTQLIDNLSDGHRGRELTVFAGHCGTAVQAIPHVIADRLAYVDRSNPQGTISGLAGVWVIHAGDLFDNTQRDTPSTEDIQGLFHEARERRLILAVDEAELLAQDFGDSERRDQILRELGRPSDVPAVAIYHLGEDETYEAGQVSLGLYNAVPVPLLPDPEKRTRTLLKANFAPYWQQQGYSIHDPERAFELIFKLAPGLKAVHYRSGKSWEERKLLPYAVIDVGIEAIEMLAKNQDILYVAQAALSALEPIRAREREIEKSEMRDALKRAEEDICRLISKTKPEFRAQIPMELTRAHLMAQLFYPSGTQFHPFPLASNETATVPRTASNVEQRLSK